MTHDELLEHINKDIDQGGFANACGEWFPARSLFALRAVVELHKEKLDDVGRPVCSECTINLSWKHYPCPTIQEIEKELK